VNNNERYLPCCVPCYFVFPDVFIICECKQAYIHALAFLILDIILCFVSVSLLYMFSVFVMRFYIYDEANSYSWYCIVGVGDCTLDSKELIVHHHHHSDINFTYV
jgi:hypothetical protein